MPFTKSKKEKKDNETNVELPYRTKLRFRYNVIIFIST